MTVQELIDFLQSVEDKTRTVAIDGPPMSRTFQVLDSANCLDHPDIFDGHVVLG